MAQKLFIPNLGTLMILAEDWTFRLFFERRNDKMIEAVAEKTRRRQTIDPMLSAYFRDVAHKKTMLELVHSRDDIQHQARTELKSKFEHFDIECVDVLIGKPEANSADDGKIENLLEQLRQLSLEQIETYDKQQTAVAKKMTLNEATAKAEIASRLTRLRPARARKDVERRVGCYKAESESVSLEGDGKADKVYETFPDRSIAAMPVRVNPLKFSAYNG